MPIVLALLLTACSPTVEDEIDVGRVCALSQGTAGAITLDIMADSQDCSSDHEGVAYSCTASVDGTTVTISTTYTPGDDPNDLCAPPSVTHCSVAVPDGELTVVYAGTEAAYTVPSDVGVCLPGGTVFDERDTGWGW